MAEQYISSHVSLIFDGGMASGGELHFYEYSRCVYAYSRFLQTIEYYRREGIVADRIVGSANTDIIIRAPQQGSFVINATVRAAQKVIPFLKKIPFEAVVALVIDTIKEARPEDDVSKTLARLAASADTNVPTVSAQRSRAISQGSTPSTREILSLAEWAKSSRDPAIERAGLSQEALRELYLRADADLYRQKEIMPYSTGLEKIPVSDLTRLTSRVRPMISEIGLPLRKSAKNVSFASGESRRPMARLDISDIKNIDSREIDRQTECFDASVKSYDKETGHGRLRMPEKNDVYPFSIPSNLRGTLNRKVTVGMNRKHVTFTAQCVRDMSGSVTSYIVSDVAE